MRVGFICDLKWSYPESLRSLSYFLVNHKDSFKLGDHGHNRSRQNEVRFDQVKIGLPNDLK